MTVEGEGAVRLPVFALPLGSWLVWGPGAALLIGAVSGSLGFGAGLYDGASALGGGVAVVAALLVTGLLVQPWRAREARQWMPWVLAAQMLTLVLTVVWGLVVWRALGAEVGPLGFTGALAFIAGQMAQTAAFAQADRAARDAFDPEAQAGDGSP